MGINTYGGTATGGGGGRTIGKSGVATSQTLNLVQPFANNATDAISYGSWSVVAASSAAEWLTLGAFCSFNGSYGLAVQVGMGTNNNEVALTEALLTTLPATSNQYIYSPFPMPARIPAGSRVVVRAAVVNAPGPVGVNVLLQVGLYANVEGS